MTWSYFFLLPPNSLQLRTNLSSLKKLKVIIASAYHDLIQPCPTSLKPPQFSKDLPTSPNFSQSLSFKELKKKAHKKPEPTIKINIFPLVDLQQQVYPILLYQSEHTQKSVTSAHI